jgi:hypothetical protein
MKNFKVRKKRFIKINVCFNDLWLMDNISIIILLRSLFIFHLINSGWTVKKCKGSKNTYQMFKSKLN